MGTKYPDYIYEYVRQRRGDDEFDDSHDDEIDAMPRKDVFNHVCTWVGLIDYGYTIRQWVDDIYDLDLDAEVGEPDKFVCIPEKDGKYSTKVYQAVRQRMGYDEDDNFHDDEIDEMDREDVLDEVLSWNGLLGYGYEVSEWVEDIYGIALADYEK